MNEERRAKLDALMDALFCRNDCLTLRRGGRLRKFTQTLLACQLMDLKELETLCKKGEKNIVATKIIFTAKECGFSKKDLYEMGKCIASAWLDEIDRATNLDGGREIMEKCALAIGKQADMKKDMERLKIEVEDLKHQNQIFQDSMESELKQMKDTLKDMSGMVLQTQRLLMATFHNGQMPVLPEDVEVHEEDVSPAPITQEENEEIEENNNSSSSSSKKRNNNSSSSSSSSKKRKTDATPPATIGYKPINHKNIFSNGKPFDMDLGHFLANVYIFNVNLESTDPFRGFKPDSTAKGKYRKLYRYTMKKMVTQSENEKLKEAKAGGSYGCVPLEKHQDVFDVMAAITPRLVKRIDEAYYKFHPKSLKKDKYGRIVTTHRTGSVGNRLQDVETENRKLPHSERDSFFFR